MADSARLILDLNALKTEALHLLADSKRWARQHPIDEPTPDVRNARVAKAALALYDLWPVLEAWEDSGSDFDVSALLVEIASIRKRLQEASRG